MSINRLPCAKHDISGEKARTTDLELRIRTLEKQRGELIEGFRKQLKLIDILKRQKVRCWC